MENPKDQIVVDLKTRLRKYLPILFEFLDIHDFTIEQWRTLNQNLADRHYERLTKYEQANNYLLVKPNIYDMISASLNGHQPAIIFWIL